jgi:transketolase
MSASEATTSAAPPLPAPRDKHLRRMADTIRVLSMDAVEKANSGHPGMPMGMADIATVLWGQFLKFDPADPHWPDRDRFILSNGHGSMLLYSLLHLTGYADMTMDEIRTFRQLGSRCAGHPERGHAAGIEVTTGPLGQGIANSVGMALAEHLQATRYGKDIVDHYTYVFCGDGCLMEGISQEAISFAGNLKLGKLILFWDDNHITIDGSTALARHEDELERFDASGWHTQRIDGHDTDAIADAIRKAQADDRPSMIACRTIIAFGAPTKAGTAGAHGSALGAKEVAGTRERLGWTAPPFVVPDDMIEAWHKVGQRSKAAAAAWRERFAKSPQRAEFDAEQKGEVPKAARDALTALRNKFAGEAPKTATRQASGSVLDALAPAFPALIGGSADLTPSNNTKAKSQKEISREDFAASYIHYGIREHGMAAAMNGMAAHGGIVPYGGTFLVFTDYCRPSIRLSALMKLRVIYVMTHDSIGLGEDGPTHQPVEHLAALRAIPHLQVFRPADAVETAECWELALAHTDRPSVLALTRQPLAAQRKDAGENRSARGAYVLAEADGGARKITLLATGSEVEIAMAARQQLAAKGVAAAVVSMPCWRLFEAQDEAYRRSVLGTAPRVGIEAAVEFGWSRYLGDRGRFIGMHDFGASAPIEALYKHFGITAEAVVESALDLV